MAHAYSWHTPSGPTIKKIHRSYDTYGRCHQHACIHAEQRQRKGVGRHRLTSERRAGSRPPTRYQSPCSANTTVSKYRLVERSFFTFDREFRSLILLIDAVRSDRLTFKTIFKVCTIQIVHRNIVKVRDSGVRVCAGQHRAFEEAPGQGRVRTNVLDPCI